MRKLFFITLGIVAPVFVYCQNYFIPVNIQDCYLNGTRSLSGKPGENYFQNAAQYSIKVNFDPQKGRLSGNEEVTYYNNSNDTLYYMVIRLYHNIFKKGNSRSENIPEEYINDGVQINSLVIRGTQYIDNPKVFLRTRGTNMTVTLPDYLLPGKSIKLQISWKTTIPATHIHRFGNYGASDWFIAYWYPQISVYDDIDGWDMINYTGLTEFYNDFSDFDVEISVPKGHIIWATGNWENPREILKDKILDRYNRAQYSSEQVNIVTLKDYENGSVFRKSKALKYHFNAENVTDFAFAVSDDYLWDATSVLIDSIENKRTVIHTAYNKDTKSFYSLSDYGAKSINHFSKVSLGIEYPFDKVTIFNGDGGMEFPMMVNQDAGEKSACNFTAMHELFHAYFPFMTGINERRYAWMDEGLTTYLPIITEQALGGYYFTMPRINANYLLLAGTDDEAALMTPSYLLQGFSYHHQAYYRSSVAFFMLEQYLGRDLFRKCIREFVKRWEGKHPTGYDLIFTFENVSGLDLYWLINPWFFERGSADIGITKAEITDKGLRIELENIGGFPVPVDVRIYPKEGDMITHHINIDAWKNGEKSYILELSDITGFEKIEINNPNIPDKNSDNNKIYPSP